MQRSYLFAPGHHAKLLRRVFEAGADAVILDLEDAVPPDAKQQARTMVAGVLAERPAWVRINTVRTDLAAADLAAVAGLAFGIRIPKAESAADVQWVADRAPGTPLICAIESARGLLAASEIGTVPGVRHLSIGGVDLRRDLGAGDGNLQTLYARSHIVVASRAVGLGPPIDSVYPHLDDDRGLREQAKFARSLGFFGKSAIHPRQLRTIHDVFTPSAQELTWARAVLDAFAAADGNAVKLPDGEFVDLPVADRAPAPAGARRPTPSLRRGHRRRIRGARVRLTQPGSHMEVNTMADMTGQVALVTGGTRGIGLAICERLMNRGIKVAAGYAGLARGPDRVDRRAGAYREAMWVPTYPAIEPI